MMKGNNSIHLCHSEMIEAMQQYLNEIFTLSPGEVKDVAEETSSGTSTFVIRIEGE